MLLLKLRIGLWALITSSVLGVLCFSLQFYMRPVMITSGTFTKAALWEEGTRYFWHQQSQKYFCNAIASPTLAPSYHLWFLCFLLTASQSLYNPCNNPGRKGRQNIILLDTNAYGSYSGDLPITEYLITASSSQKLASGNVFQRRAGCDAH